MIIKGHRDAVSHNFDWQLSKILLEHTSSFGTRCIASQDVKFENCILRNEISRSKVKIIVNLQIYLYTFILMQITAMAASDESLYSASRDMSIRSWNPDDGTQKCIVEVSLWGFVSEPF